MRGNDGGSRAVPCNGRLCPTAQVMNVPLHEMPKDMVRGLVAMKLAPPGIPVTVVRVMVPQLESWAVDHGRIGARGAAAWNRALAELSALQQKLQEQGDKEQGVPA